MSTYLCSQICTTLNATFALGLDRKYYHPKELNKKLKKFFKSGFLYNTFHQLQKAANRIFTVCHLFYSVNCRKRDYTQKTT